jgi:hypothetical protein
MPLVRQAEFAQAMTVEEYIKMFTDEKRMTDILASPKDKSAPTRDRTKLSNVRQLFRQYVILGDVEFRSKFSRGDGLMSFTECTALIWSENTATENRSLDAEKLKQIYHVQGRFDQTQAWKDKK